jgi:hypothetical protein
MFHLRPVRLRVHFQSHPADLMTATRLEDDASGHLLDLDLLQMLFSWSHPFARGCV